MTDDRVLKIYHANKPVMGAPDDTDAGHGASWAGARIQALREFIYQPELEDMEPDFILREIKAILA